MNSTKERDVFYIRSNVIQKPEPEEEEQSENEDDFVQAAGLLPSASTMVQESEDDCILVLNSHSDK